ncbi:hypothetical protein [Micromonospora sp. NBC_01412]|uniref:hypothetical protein n=1 Tax=Micromonospora sp. NBC_01412 TaxID=2903590 RepID=UPI00324796D2
MVATPGRGLGRNALSDLSRVLHDCHAHVISGPRVVLTEADGKLVDVEDEEQAGSSPPSPTRSPCTSPQSN